MKQNIQIKGVGIYHPPVPVTNEQLYEHFDARGIETRGLMKALGRQTRYFVTNDSENALTMGIEAANCAIENAGISAEDLDMIVFVTDTPEYLLPSNALKVHQAIGAMNANLVYDLNTNCTGMIVAIDQVAKVMKATPNLNTALVVASTVFSRTVDKNNSFLRTAYNDGSGAFVLHKESSNAESGVIDTVTKVNSANHDLLVYPKAGLTPVLHGDATGEDALFDFIPHSVDYFSEEWKELIVTLLERNGLTANDIKAYMFQQFSNDQNIETLSKLGVEPTEDNYVFVGEKYGYMGASCIAFAFHDALKAGKLTSGDYILFVSVAAFLY